MADGLDLPEILRRTVQANAKFYKAWVDLSLDYMRGLSEILGTPSPGMTASAPAPAAEPGPGVLVAEGEEGATVRAAFLVTNDLGRKLTCELFASDFAGPDGVELKVPVAFEPAVVELEPGQQQVVQAVMTVDPALPAGVAHTGSFAIRGMDGFSVPVVLRRRHGVEDSARQPQASAERPQANAERPQTSARAPQARGKSTQAPKRQKRS